MPTDSLVIGNQIELLGGGVPSNHPQCAGAIFQLGPGWTLGSPQFSTSAVASLLLGGGLPLGEHADNRTPSLPIVITVPSTGDINADRSTLAGAREVLTQSISADRWTLVWTRDGGPGPMILDCFHAHPVDVTYSQAADKSLACQMTVSFDALPYARSDDPEILSFNSPSVGWVAPPSSIQIDSFATSTNMFTGDTANFEGSAGFWSPRAACTVATSTAQAHSGTHSLAVTSNSTSTMSVSSAGTVNATQAVYCDPGETVSGYAWVRSAATVRAVQVGIEFYDPSGLTQLGVTFGTAVNDSTSAWTQIFSGPIVVPAGAYLMRLVVQIPSIVASEVHYIDDPDIERAAANWFLGPTGPPTDTANFETSIGTWTNIANAALTRTTAQFHGGTASMQLASVAAGAMSAGHCQVANVLTQGMPCFAGDVVAVSGWVRTASLARTVQFGVAFYDATGTVVGSTLFGSTVTDSTTWQWVSSGDQVVPPNAAFAIAVYQVNATAAANEVHYQDDVSIDRGPTFSYNDTGLWFQSTVGAYGRMSAHWVRTTHDYALYDHYLADPVDLTGLKKLSLWVGLGTNKYSQWHTGRATCRIVLYDANGNSITSTVTFNAVASALTTVPRWQKISGAIPFSGTFDYTTVSRYTIGIWNKVESIPQAGMPLGQQVLQAECYLDTLRADGPTTGNPFARGAIYSIPGVVGTAPAALSLQLQPGPASPPTTITFNVIAGSNNWTAPAGVTLVQIAEAWGAGGGGGYGISARNGGGGAGAGEYACEYNIPVTPSTVYHPYNGVYGNGGTSGSHPGTNGQASYFIGDGGKQVYAHGGQGGGQVFSTRAGLGGHGSTNSKHFDGGDGADPSTYNNALPGGGGGSSGGTSQDGDDGGGSSQHVPGAARVGGGPGGDGGHQIVQDGPLNGSPPPSGPGGGGGGGATRLDGTSGLGAGGYRGQTRLTFAAGAGALMKTAVIHLPSRDVPSSYAPYIVTGNGTDVPNGATTYTAPVTGALQARYKGTYQVVLTNFSWATPTVSRTLTVTIQQHKADGTNATTVLTRTIANVSTDPDHVNLANGIVLMGTVTLPLAPIAPGNNTDLIQVLVNDTNTADRFYDTLLLDTAGQTIIYSASGAGVQNLWVTEPDLGLDLGIVYGSAVGDWDTAVSVLSDVPVASGTPLAVLPGENPLLVYSVQGAPGVQASYNPKWLLERLQ